MNYSFDKVDYSLKFRRACNDALELIHTVTNQDTNNSLQ